MLVWTKSKKKQILFMDKFISGMELFLAAFCVLKQYKHCVSTVSREIGIWGRVGFALNRLYFKRCFNKMIMW